ncbi:hypothetical protein [Nocardiopsis sp. CNT312]|uniref:hypothetical protein n=1 Tax=Nocardiopsis sp. CNT312 TaxID=1137268 RepID=UPI0004BA5569|nr:hypothetical protein [Nocardiopsis sp. CNT312]
MGNALRNAPTTSTAGLTTPEPAETLSEFLGVPLAPRDFTLDDGMRVGVDYADTDRRTPTVLAQCYLHWGQVKSAHRNKVIADAFKLAWLRDTRFPEARALLVLSTPFTRLLGSGAWLPSALASHHIHVLLMDQNRNIQLSDATK